MLEIWYVALRDGLLPSLFKSRSQDLRKVPGSKMASQHVSYVKTIEIHEKTIQKYLLQNHYAKMFEI